MARVHTNGRADSNGQQKSVLNETARALLNGHSGVKDSNSNSQQSIHATRSNGMECCVRFRCLGGIDRWKESIDNIDERCDLSGLSTHSTKYQVASTGLGDVCLAKERQSIIIPDSLYASLKETCVQRNISLQSIILFAVHQMLKGFGNGSHTVTASLSHQEDSNNLHGSWTLFQTIVPHPGKEGQSVAQAITNIEVKQRLEQYTDFSIDAISKLQQQGLFDLLVVFGDLEDAHHDLLDFPLAVVVNTSPLSLQLAVEFSKDLFTQSTIYNFADALKILLEEAVTGRAPVAGIELLSAEQKAQLEEWNRTDGEYPSPKRLHHLIEETAERCEDQVAVTCEQRELTYGELNGQANRLARYLSSMGILPEQLVALFLDKSELLIITILSVWKSGAAYVPIDPTYPDDRVRFALDDTKARVVISSHRHAERLQRKIAGDRDLWIVHLEPLLEFLAQDPSDRATRNLEHLKLTSKQLAYVTYTSGTTGFPKGIFKEHTSVVNSITDLSALYSVAGQQDEVILLFSAYVFEPFVRQMLMALVNGHVLAIISDVEKYDADKLIPFMQRYGVTYLNGTASVLQEYDFSSCPSLKRIILVGENLTDARYRTMRQRFKKRILNEYGFTESAFVTALKIFDPHSSRTDTSLGRPVRNVKCYILNPSLKRVPVGATGELHIGGLGISRGYMNRPDLTPLKFISNPFQTEHEKQLGINALMYKTGDLARWLPNGEIEYLGRADFQIKLRGIRIEPGEIESTLTTYPGIRTSLVVSKKLRTGIEETSSEHLVGYYVCDNAELSEAELLAFLETKLPRYMIPTRLVQLSQIPVNINGKADLRALPLVDISQTTAVISDVRDDVEVALRQIWSDVLGTREVSISRHDNFFRLGGHSITCIQLTARIRQRLSVNISVEDVFATKTLDRMATFIRECQSEENSQHINGHSAEPIGSQGQVLNLPDLAKIPTSSEIYLANSLQQGFVYHYLKNIESSDAYIMHSVLHYNAPLLPDLLKKAWEHAQRIFAVLRLRFIWEKEVFQVIDQGQRLDWRFLLFADVEGAVETQILEDLQHNDLAEGYRLDSGNLFRIYLIKHADSRFSCLFSCHHSILDGWSLPLLFEHVHETYLQLLSGNSIKQTADKVYPDSQRYLQMHREDHVDYWAAVVNQITERCDMNALLNEKSRYKIPLANYDKIVNQQEKTLVVPGDDFLADLRQSCASQGITLHSILQFVWHVVLHTYCGGSQTVTGTTISGRTLPVNGIERSIGLYINTLPLVVNHALYTNKTIIEAIADIQTMVNAMNARGNVELGHLSKTDLKHGLFDTLFVLENYPNLDKSRALTHQRELRYVINGSTEKLDYPLAVIAREMESSAGFTFTICYASELFEENTISELLHMVKDTVTQIAKNLDEPVLSLEYLSSAQLEQLAIWNTTEAEFPDMTLHEMFELEAERKAQKTAVIYEDVALTYRELNERANRMAHQLKHEIAPNPNSLVALVMDKSEHMMVSILAVWKTGAAYVPIDPLFPDDRVRYIMEDTKPVGIIADTRYIPRIKGIVQPTTSIYASDVAAVPVSEWSISNPAPSSKNTDLAYVIYTSGTTGRPKGVMVEHHGVVNLQVSLSKIFGLRDTDDEVVLSFSNYIFDHFVEQMTDALLNGQTLLVLNDAMRGDKERLYRYIEKNRVTYLSGTPSVISMYEFSRFKDHLRRIDCVGEAFSEPVFDQIRETFHGLIINGYGPTEVSITTHKRLYPFPERRTDKSIGRQVDNSTSYVLDENMSRVPIGAVGELYLGGDGVARGYHNRPDLTAQRFPINPFQTKEERRDGRNSRLYKTGDLVRWIPGSSGEVEYLGRNDFQIKIRGLRIEPGEIEAVLSSYPEIKQSVVVAKDRLEGDQKYLVGYYVADAAIPSSSIRRFMQSHLPDYMIPSRLIPIDKLPVTASGKLDTKALPPGEEDSVMDIVAPRSEVEQTLCEIWSELLDLPVDNVSVNNDFFALGGDSLKSTKLSFMISEAFNRPISVSTLFRHRTIEAMAHLIVNNAVDMQEIPQVTHGNSDMISVSPAQERLLFIHELENGSAAYNITMAVKFISFVDTSFLEQALRLTVSRHEALRTLLVKDKTTGIYRQKILDSHEAHTLLPIKVSKVTNLEHVNREISTFSQYIFSFADELPLKACIISHEAGGHGTLYMILTFHHTSFDAWSWNIFQQDLRYLYEVCQGKKSLTSLPKLRVQYKEYSHHHRQQLSDERFRALSQFWSQQLGGLEPLHLITDHTRPPRFRYSGADVGIELDDECAKGLKSVAKHCKSSLYAVLLTAYCLMLASYTNQTDISVGIPVSHRAHPEFESVIGFFVNLLVLRVDLSQGHVRGLITKVMKELVEAQLHQDMPFQEVTKLLHVEHDASRHPLVQTVFNYETSSGAGHDLGMDDEQTLLFQQYQPTHQEYSIAKFDLNATVTNMKSGLRVNFNYATSLFKEDTIVGFMHTYRHLLRQLSQLSGNTSDDVQVSLASPSANHSDHLPLPQSRLPSLTGAKRIDSLTQAFEYEARLAADKIAIVQEDRTITYAELNNRANQLARYMLSISRIGIEDCIALVLDKSIETVICILAIWKAGAAYVPLDPTYPTERVRLILQETRANFVIVNSRHASRFDYNGAQVIQIDSSSIQDYVSRKSTSNLDSRARLDNLAYIIFTSGTTTGKPKGVLVERKGVLNLRDVLRERYFGSSCTKQHGVLFLSNYVFDFSVEQLVLSVMSGHKLIIPSEDFLAQDGFYNLANRHGLSYLSGTPSLLHHIDLTQLHHLEVVTAAGEEFRASQYEKMRREFCGPIYNAYGITETTVYNIITEFAPDASYENALRECLPGTRAYLLNRALQPVPLGAVGELYLAGDSVARGYLNQHLLTNECFIANPFRDEDDIAAGRFTRMYKTGDLARCRFNDYQQPQLQYIGRSDLQVKLRGFRIEISEVQNALAGCSGVKECAVVAKYDQGSPAVVQSLVGYYTTISGSAVSEADIIASMESKLPAYMIPQYLRRIEGVLPVTINGKLDVRKLPDIDTKLMGIIYSPPRNILEAKLCKLWSSTLGTEQCGIDDDLFKLGGDSIVSLHLVAQIHNQVGYKVTVRDIFEQRTIRKLYDNILDRDGASCPPFRTEQGLVNGEAPLLPIQEWFLSKELKNPNHWNHSFCIRTPELDVTRLKEAVSQLQEYHDAFRMRLTKRDGLYVQSYASEKRPDQLREFNVRNTEGHAGVNQVLRQWQSGFNIETGPVCSIGYLHGYSDGSARVWFSIHHLVVDTVSWEILLRDLRTLYHSGNLGGKGSSMRQWAEAVQKYQATASEKEYWDTLIPGMVTTANALPLPRSSREHMSRVINAEKIAILLRQRNDGLDVNAYHCLLAAIGMALQDIALNKPSLVTLEGHGREEGIDPSLDVSRTMGWFTSMYPFELPCIDRNNLAHGVITVKERLGQVPNQGVGYGALYGYTQHPLPQVSVNYLGQLARKSPSSDEWVLAVGNDGYEYGLITSPDDRDKSSTAVDVTAACINGEMTINVTSAWNFQESERFISTIEEGLNEIINAVSSYHTSPNTPLLPKETFTPYFEYHGHARCGPTLFLLPPGEGGAESYFNNILKHLPQNNMVAFNNYYLHSKDLHTFEALADLYLGYVRTIQPEGPYHFLGWSFGGILALEIARRLVAAGEKINTLAFIDTYFNVRNATASIGLGDLEVLDSIHHRYDPDPASFGAVGAATKRIVLFKAMKSNDQYKTENQRRLYEYYDKTQFNDLDRFFKNEVIELVPLTGHTHFSWAHNPRQVDGMCDAIRGLLG